MAQELKLNRDFLNTQFASWKLQPIATVNRYQLSTTGHASGVVSTALDFLHTRASVLRNHLLLSEGRLFVFTQSESTPGFWVYELLPAPLSDQGLLAQQVAELPADAGAETAGGAVEAVVDCSLAVVAECNPSQSPPCADEVSGAPSDAGDDAGTARADGQSAASTTVTGTAQLLLSRGRGDIVLMRRRGSAVTYSNVVHPIRPQLPYTGVRPIILEAAVSHANGDITALAWAMRSKDAKPGRAGSAACCELFAIRLRPSGDDATGGKGAHQQQQHQQQEQMGPERASEPGSSTDVGGLHLRTVGVQLLLRTKLPPYTVRVFPPSAPPAPPAFASAAGEAAASAPLQPGEAAVVVAFDPSTADLEEEDEPAGAGLGPGGGGDGRGGEGDDDDDMDPRTLEQAAARLAHMTAEERAGPQAAAQWADIYKESGPDGVGAMGGEPSVDLAAWRLGGDGGDALGGAAEEGSGKALSPCWRLSCGAHRLLTAECAVWPGQPQQPLLVGLTDDVDCAVVSVERRGSHQRLQEQEPAAEGGQLQEAAAEAGGEAAEPLQVRHALSIPALAYVAAGKTYKRHLLLSSVAVRSGSDSNGTGGGPANSAPAAVLVESQRFMYLYGATSTRQEYGKQQVVELGLEEGETVLGARLVELRQRLGSGLKPAEGETSDASVLVVIATQRRLLSYRLRA